MTDPLTGEQDTGETPRAPAKARITASLRRVILRKETSEELNKKTDVEKGKVWKSHVNK